MTTDKGLVRARFFFFFSSRRRHTRYWRDWSSDVCSSDLAVGEKLEERLTLVPLETSYRAQFADGSHLDVHSDPEAFAGEVARLAGPAEADRLRRYLAELSTLYDLQLRTFIDRKLDTPLDLVGPELVQQVRRRGFGGVCGHVGRAFADDRVRRVFSFQALCDGVCPCRAIAGYA